MLKIGFLTALIIANASVVSPIAAGRWQISNELQEAIIDGRRDAVRMPASKPITICLSAEQASKGIALAFSDPDLCKLENSSIDGAHYEYVMICRATESSDTITTNSTGEFSADGYSGKSVSVQKHGNNHIEMRSKINAKRVGDC